MLTAVTERVSGPYVLLMSTLIKGNRATNPCHFGEPNTGLRPRITFLGTAHPKRSASRAGSEDDVAVRLPHWRCSCQGG